MDAGNDGSLALRVGAGVLVAYVGLMIVGLALGFHEPLFFGLGERGGQGIDFFCVPKAFLNLLEGRSAFDTWGAPAYGPHATWFVLHPAVAVTIGAYLCWLPPWWAYAAWVAVTLVALLACGLALAQHAGSALRRLFVVAALLASPVTYLLLLSGNVHGVIVVAVTILLLGLHELASGAHPAWGVSPTAKVALGLCLSLLCKPVLVLVVPALLISRRTRTPALASIGAYVAVSALLLLVPAWNPEAVGLERLGWLALHPSWVREQLEVYRHRFVLIPEMLDSAMHWLHMLAQSDNAWDHVQIFSLPVMLRSLAPAAAGGLRSIALLPVVLAPLLLRVPEARQSAAAAWLVVLALASHFLGYAIAWEYQYAQLLAVTAALLALSTLRSPSPRWSRLALAGLALLYLPTPYVWLANDGLSSLDLAVLRAFRVGPALLVAVAALKAFLQHVPWRAALVATADPAEAPPTAAAPDGADRARQWLSGARRRLVLGLALALLLAPQALLFMRRATAAPSAEARSAEVDRLIARSRALLDSGQARASLTPLERARRLAPDAFAVQNNLCVAYGMLDRKDEAVERCRRAVALDPDDRLARNNLAWVESIRAE
jgi:tetratricopeptide (TPR) repeat protein